MCSAPRKFCRRLNDGLPSSSTATISPSITVSSGRRFSARVMVGNRSLKFFPLREARCGWPLAAVAVELELKVPLRTLGYFGNCEAENRFEESGVHSAKLCTLV